MTADAIDEAASPAVEALLDAFHARTPIRTGSLIVTIFGDAVVPRGGVLSLASLLRLTRAFRIGDGLVRTALSRLVAEGWFERSKSGRNTFYRLTRTGARTFSEATDKIYRMGDDAWTGTFDAILLHDGDREGFRAAAAAAGYGQLSGDVMIAPSGIARWPLAEVPAALQFTLTPHDVPTAVRLAQRSWPLGDVERRYSRFVSLYEPITDTLRAGTLRQAIAVTLSEVGALIVRISLIHDYRRIVLADPHLPSALLPHGWQGARARALCAETYRVVVSGAERWLGRFGESDTGRLPPPDSTFARRFDD